MFKLYEIGRDWSEEGTLISSHKTEELAKNRLNKEIKKRVKTVYYVRENFDTNNKQVIYDYGLWNKFFVIREVDDARET